MALNTYVKQWTATLGTAAGTAVFSGTAVGFPTSSGAVMDVAFTYGSSGTADGCKVYIQNSVDGTNFYDVACVVFGTANATRVGAVSVTSGTAWTTPQDGALTDNTILTPAALGADWRVKAITSAGYTASTVVVSVSPKP